MRNMIWVEGAQIRRYYNFLIRRQIAVTAFLQELAVGADADDNARRGAQQVQYLRVLPPA